MPCKQAWLGARLEPQACACAWQELRGVTVSWAFTTGVDGGAIEEQHWVQVRVVGRRCSHCEVQVICLDDFHSLNGLLAMAMRKSNGRQQRQVNR
jgi:hypothetical protein